LPPARYAFRKRTVRALARGFDAVGGSLWRRAAARPARAAAPRRILLVRLDHLGDALFLGPALAALREGLPEAELVLLGGPWVEPLYAGTGVVDSIRVAEVPWFARPRRRGGLPTWVELLRWIRSRRFDAAIDFRGDVRHLAWFALAGIPVRLGYGRTGGAFLLTDPVPYRRAHEVERNLDLVRVLVPAAAPGPLRPLPYTAADRDRVDDLLQSVGCSRHRAIVAFHVTTGYPSKRWEPEAMARAIDLVDESGLGRAVVVGTEAERATIDAVVRRTRTSPFVLAGRTRLTELAALLHRARAFVGHDSGPGHLAVAAGVPTVLLYSGVNDLEEWGPWRGTVRVLTAFAECSPCGLAVCNRQHECMRPIAPEAVVAALRELVSAHRRSTK
jgi:ADP-heptose:LPS heptosyltransferase